MSWIALTASENLADLVAGDAPDRTRRRLHLDGHVAVGDRLEPVGEAAHVVVAQVLEAGKDAPHAHPQRERDPDRDADRQQRAGDRRDDDQQPRRADGGMEAGVGGGDPACAVGQHRGQLAHRTVVVAGERADRVQRDDRDAEQEADDPAEGEAELAPDGPADAQEALHVPVNRPGRRELERAPPCGGVRARARSSRSRPTPCRWRGRSTRRATGARPSCWRCASSSRWRHSAESRI